MLKSDTINWDDVAITYSDLEVRYNEDRGEFLFLQKKDRESKYFGKIGTYFVDAITKGEVLEDLDLAGFEKFDKSLILEERAYTPNELLKIYNELLENKVNFRFSRKKRSYNRKQTAKKVNLGITDDTKYEYEDIEVLYNKDNQEFYFLKRELDKMLNMILFDAISGSIVTAWEIAGFKQFDKSLILEKRPYTSEELSILHKMLMESKVNFTFPESETVKNRNAKQSISIPKEINVTDDTKYKYNDLEVRVNFKSGSIYFLVDKVFSDEQGFNQIVRYDAINGQQVSNRILSDYDELERKIFFTVDRDYTAKEISAKYHMLLENGIIIPDEIKSNNACKGSK